MARKGGTSFWALAGNYQALASGLRSNLRRRRLGGSCRAPTAKRPATLVHLAALGAFSGEAAAASPVASCGVSSCFSSTIRYPLIENSREKVAPGAVL